MSLHLDGGGSSDPVSPLQGVRKSIFWQSLAVCFTGEKLRLGDSDWSKAFQGGQGSKFRQISVDWMNVNTLVTTGGSRSLLETVRTL